MNEFYFSGIITKKFHHGKCTGNVIKIKKEKVELAFFLSDKMYSECEENDFVLIHGHIKTDESPILMADEIEKGGC